MEHGEGIPMTEDCGMLIKLIANRIDSRFEEELSSQCQMLPEYRQR